MKFSESQNLTFQNKLILFGSMKAALTLLVMQKNGLIKKVNFKQLQYTWYAISDELQYLMKTTRQ